MNADHLSSGSKFAHSLLQVRRISANIADKRRSARLSTGRFLCENARTLGLS